jgi:gluconate 2-dehydrogenase gamma chain
VAKSGLKGNFMNMDVYLNLSRRSLMQQAFLLMGATTVSVETALAATKRRRKHFLSAAQFALLAAVADTIMPTTDTPGALAAGVPAKLDGMLRHWASADTKAKIMGGLDRVNEAAKAEKQKDFAALSSADRAAFMLSYDAKALKPVAPPANAPKPHPLAPRHWVADNDYLAIKQLVVALYYTSEIGMTQELIYEHVPGEWQPSIKVTDASRPWA